MCALYEFIVFTEIVSPKFVCYLLPILGAYSSFLRAVLLVDPHLNLVKILVVRHRRRDLVVHHNKRPFATAAAALPATTRCLLS